MAIYIARKFFTWVFPISLILSLFMSWKKIDKNSIQLNDNAPTKSESAIKIIESVAIAIISVIAFILFLVNCKQWAFALVIFCAPVYLGRAVGTYQSIGIIGSVVGIDKADKLSNREYWAFETVSYALWFADFYKFSDKLLAYVVAIPNTIVSDFLCIIVHVLLLFLYVFLSCALLPPPLFFFSKLLIKLNKIIRNKLHPSFVSDYFITRIDQPINSISLLVYFLEKTTNRHVVLRIITFVLSPILFLSDTVLFLVGMLCSFASTSLGYIFLLFRMVKRTAGKIIVWINNLSDRRIVIISFRVALIGAFTITVVNNRYMPLVKNYEASTAVLEFVASAILIPVTFEWISAMREKNHGV